MKGNRKAHQISFEYFLNWNLIDCVKRGCTGYRYAESTILFRKSLIFMWSVTILKLAMRISNWFWRVDKYMTWHREVCFVINLIHITSWAFRLSSSYSRIPFFLFSRLRLFLSYEQTKILPVKWKPDVVCIA